uniref:Uncharacterized protein n=1 Tax=uncultured bacterium A1Q1_fos_485 TaxID=1256576 RepID=L7VZ76_9BACT|nr:hypothetical protein [uncultured bacterium A1Q1_fos_485]
MQPLSETLAIAVLKSGASARRCAVVSAGPCDDATSGLLFILIGATDLLAVEDNGSLCSHNSPKTNHFLFRFGRSARRQKEKRQSLLCRFR